jgi:hypothetical protein
MDNSFDIEAGEPHARLLRVLREQYRDDQFDEVNISIDAVRNCELLAALGFLEPTVDRRRRALSRRSAAAIEKWINRVADRVFGGLYLHRDSRGWSYVDPIATVAPTGMTGCAR